MNRRDILKSVVAGAGALPAAAQHQGHHAAAQSATGATKPATTAWKPLLFDAHQNETVVALTDLIIPATDTPGAREAKVNEYIDLILNDGPVERRSRFVKGLGALDGECIRKHGKPFTGCTKAQQTALLESMQVSPFFREIKRLTVEGYYSSKAGFDELNKGGRVPRAFGCAGNDHPAKA